MIRFPAFLLAVSLLFTAWPAFALNYGADQVARFSEQRKAAGVFLAQDSDYLRFLENAFNGLYTSVPLQWDNNEPQGNAYAENTPNDDRTHIIIRVSATLPPLDQVAALIYECKNAQNERMFAHYIKEAYLGSISKQEFIHSILRLEHVKLMETRAFLIPQSPFRETDIAATEFYRRMFHTPEDFDEFIEYLHRIKRKEYDVFDMYSKFYDFITMTPQKRKEQLDQEAARRQAEAAAPAAVDKGGQ